MEIRGLGISNEIGERAASPSCRMQDGLRVQAWHVLSFPGRRADAPGTTSDSAVVGRRVCGRQLPKPEAGRRAAVGESRCPGHRGDARGHGHTDSMRSLARAILQAYRGVVTWSRVYRLLTAIESECALPA
jgi:hypothetical protein